MIKFKITSPKFTQLRTLPARAEKYFQPLLQQSVKPYIEREIHVRIQEPGPVHIPFEFGTLKSQQAYFATKGFGEGIPSRRTHQLIKDWTVRIDIRLLASEIIIYNANPIAKYAYGSRSQRQIPGHARTGWGRNLPTELDLISKVAVRKSIAAYRLAVQLALKGG